MLSGWCDQRRSHLDTVHRNTASYLGQISFLPHICHFLLGITSMVWNRGRGWEKPLLLLLLHGEQVKTCTLFKSRARARKHNHILGCARTFTHTHTHTNMSNHTHTHTYTGSFVTSKTHICRWSSSVFFGESWLGKIFFTTAPENSFERVSMNRELVEEMIKKWEEGGGGLFLSEPKFSQLNSHWLFFCL